ncbi:MULTISPECIES: hypothetical protein [Phenylobacterium]|uniref:Uncharacterized protein n=1 Tax=Phenylobacterium koreense TaxID=266125 RepID=A0ABV2EFX5_9CAUL
MTRAAAALCLTALLAACSPRAPEGVDRAVLDEAISVAIGDPGTCVLIGKGGKVVYQYGSHMVCGRELPACEKPGLRTVDDLLKSAPTSGPARTASCPSNPDGSRGVAWAAGAIQDTDFVYAAVMEGERTPPGIVIAEKLGAAFARAGLGPKQ